MRLLRMHLIWLLIVLLRLLLRMHVGTILPWRLLILLLI